MNKIVIYFIPYSKMRYPTIGDYWIDAMGDWQIRVSKMDSMLSEVAVALHELFEMASVINTAVQNGKDPKAAIKDIDDFDIMFEKERAEGKQSADAEPGHDPRAPYKTDHFNAEMIERHFVTHNKLLWNRHEENCERAEKV